MSYILEAIKASDPNEKEFYQAVKEVTDSIQPVLDQNPQYRRAAVLERIVEPERVITFRVPWLDDQENVKVNRGFCVEMSSAIGPYKKCSAVSSICQSKHSKIFSLRTGF